MKSLEHQHRTSMNSNMFSNVLPDATDGRWCWVKPEDINQSIKEWFKDLRGLKIAWNELWQTMIKQTLSRKEREDNTWLQISTGRWTQAEHGIEIQVWTLVIVFIANVIAKSWFLQKGESKLKMLFKSNIKVDGFDMFLYNPMRTWIKHVFVKISTD